MIYVYQGRCPDGHFNEIEVEAGDDFPRVEWCRFCGKETYYALAYTYDPNGGEEL